MSQNDLLAKVTELKELKVLAEEIADQIAALEEAVKAEMTAQETDKLLIGTFKVTWTKYTSNRFDSKTFKVDHADLYQQYLKEVPAQRFAVA